jgi:hypothetical protein
MKMGKKIIIGNPWISIVLDEMPRKSEIADALRSGYPIPDNHQDVIHELLAGLLDGSVKLPRGKKTFPGEREFLKYKQNILASRVFRLKRLYERRGIKDAYGLAKGAVSAKYEISEDTLDTYCYPRKSP